MQEVFEVLDDIAKWGLRIVVSFMIGIGVWLVIGSIGQALSAPNVSPPPQVAEQEDCRAPVPLRFLLQRFSTMANLVGMSVVQGPPFLPLLERAKVVDPSLGQLRLEWVLIAKTTDAVYFAFGRDEVVCSIIALRRPPPGDPT